MLREFIEYIVGLGQVKTLEVDGLTYSTKNLYLMKSPIVSALEVDTLSGLTDYILSGFDSEAFAGNIVHVVSFNRVDLLSQILKDSQRETYMIAEAFAPQFNFGQWYGLESFIIAMQSCFVQNEDSAKILKLVGNIENKGIKRFGDNGITQQVEAKTGIATIEDVVVPNPVILAPFRTFVEVEQPESKFVFRMRQGRDESPECALFEADGGAWKLEAMNRIKVYLEEKLKETDITVIS